MTDKKVTQLSIQTATNGAAFRLFFMTDDGVGVPVVLTPNMLRDAISALIEAGTMVPQDMVRTLTSEVPLNENPIKVTAISVSPIEALPDHVRLTLACGLVDLQFAIPVADLLTTLETLTDATEPDPDSSRPN
jgi:hypothetical protein